MRYGFVIATFGIVLAFTAASAAEIAEAELTWDREWVPGSFLRFENLVGSITVDGASDPGVVRVRARVIAEAEDAEEARALAETIALEVVDGEHGPTVRPTWPTDRTTAFRPPTSEAGGFMSRVTSWVSSHVRKRTVAVEWNGRSVEVGDVKGGTELAVHVHVSIPLDSVTEFRQVLGTIEIARLRGETSLDIVEGLAEATQLYGTLRARTGGGRIEVKNFKGESLEVETASGEVEIVEARGDHVAVRTASGPVRIHTVTTETLVVASQSGKIELADVEPRALDVSSTEGSVDVATRLKRTREASIVAGADVVLRVGEVTPFDLVATTRKGEVKSRGVDLEPIQVADDGIARWRRGAGGIDVNVRAEQGSLTVRAIR